MSNGGVGYKLPDWEKSGSFSSCGNFNGSLSVNSSELTDADVLMSSEKSSEVCYLPDNLNNLSQ